jgi:MFS family permease
VIVGALLVRLIDEWWSWLPGGSVDDQRLDLGLTYAQSGWLLAMLWVGGLAGAPLGALADHLPRRPLAVAGAGTLSMGLVPYAVGAPYPLLIIATFAMGAASDTMIRPLESALEEVGDDQLDRLLGRQHLVSWSGDLLGPVVLAIGAETVLGWQGAFAVTAVAVGAYGAMLAVTEFPAPPRPARTSGARRAAWREARQLARRGDIIRLAVAEGLLGPLDEPILAFAVARLAAEGAGGASQGLAVGVFVGGLAGSGLVSRRGLAGIGAAGPWCTLGGVVLTALPLHPLVTAAGLTLVGFGMALVWADVHHRTLIAERGRSATVSGIVGVMATPAAAVPVIVGLVADTTSLTVGLWCYAALAVPLIPLLRTGS